MEVIRHNYLHPNALEALFVCDGIGTSSSRLDAIKSHLNSSSPGGIDVIITGHAHMLPSLSKYFDSSGDIVSVFKSSDTLRLSHSPQCPLVDKEILLHGCVSECVSDPLLTCSPSFGQHAKIILDRMPKQGSHAFVGLCQVDCAFDRDNMERNAFHILSYQDHFVRGEKVHNHDGLSCFLGQHHSSQSYVDEY
eukprot:12357084-Ditylum_brightwellii.AAC.1